LKSGEVLVEDNQAFRVAPEKRGGTGPRPDEELKDCTAWPADSHSEEPQSLSNSPKGDQASDVDQLQAIAPQEEVRSRQVRRDPRRLSDSYPR